MVSFIQHALIKENTVEARLFQELLAARVLEKGNSLIVAPTALGKTIIAGLVTAQVLHKNPERKVLLLAPTKPLAVQHEKSFKQILKIPEEKIVLLTGSVKPEERNEIWRKASVISATPQTIENDLMRGELNLKEFSLVVFDEAHKGVKDYSYVFIAQQFMRQAAEPLILALTASPGGEEERIQDVCKNLFIKNIEIKTEKDFDVKPFTHEIQTSWEKVEVPTEFLEIKKLLQEFIREQLLFLKKIGYARGIFTNFQRQKDLLQLQVQLRKDLMTKARKNPAIYQGVSKIAALLKATHAITLLETQGILALQAYFEKMKSKESRQGAPKALKTVLKDERVQKAMQLTEKLKENGIVHPKLEKLAQILQNQFSQNPESRVIVFNHYRDSAKTLVKELEKMQGVKPLRFVGQAMKERDKGMSQKEQGIALQEFKEGKYNTLLATAVAEEGLDIPEVDLVVFFEAVPSEIRSIQRRGRTGRLSNGKCVILMAKGTRDEAFYWSSKAKEKKCMKPCAS